MYDDDDDDDDKQQSFRSEMSSAFLFLQTSVATELLQCSFNK